MPDPHRKFLTGKVGNRATKYANREIAPARFKINDDALSRQALDVIDQVLGAPTEADQVRRATGQDIAGRMFDPRPLLG